MWVDSELDLAGFGWFQIRLCLLCSMGYFAVCSELLSMVMAQSGLKTSFGIASALSFSWLPFCANLASFLAAMIVGKWADAYGRKLPFIISLLVAALFGVASAFAPTFPWLIVFRSAAGFGLGGLTVVDYIVLVECTPKIWRNFSSQLVFVAGCLGVVYVAILGLCPLSNGLFDDWRVLLFCGAMPLLLTVGLRMWVSTDTPKYLVSTGKVDQAVLLLAQIKQTNCAFPNLHWKVLPTEESLVKAEHKEVNNTIWKVLKVGHTIPLAGIWIIQSLVYWGLTIFLPRILKSAGIENPSLGLFFMGVAELPGVVIATLVASRFNRSIAVLLCQTMSVAGAVLTGLATNFHFSPGLALLGGSLFYMFLIPIWGLLFVLTPESYAVEIRGTATGFHHMCKGIPSLFAPFIAASIIESTYVANAFMYIWAGVLALGFCFALWLNKALQ